MRQDHSRDRHVRGVHDTLYTNGFLRLALFGSDDEACNEPDGPWKTLAGTIVLFARRVQESAVRANVFCTRNRDVRDGSLLLRGRQLPRTSGYTRVRSTGEPAFATGTYGELLEFLCCFETQRPGSRSFDQVLEIHRRNNLNRTEQFLNKNCWSNYCTLERDLMLYHFLRGSGYCRSIKIIDDTFDLMLFGLILFFGILFCLQGFLVTNVSY